MTFDHTIKREWGDEMCTEEHNYIKWMKDESCQHFPGRMERQRKRERERGGVMTVVTGGKLNQTDRRQPGQSSDLATQGGVSCENTTVHLSVCTLLQFVSYLFTLNILSTKFKFGAV